MTKGTLYNGKKFPDYIFDKKVISYFFVEFDFVFEEEFWRIFKKLLDEARIKEIVIENLEPNYPFAEQIEVRNLPDSFIESARSMKLEGYFADKSSLYMITEQCLIFAPENKDLFCILLDREHSLGIIGFSNPKQPEIFVEYEIKDVPDYLRLTFAGKDLPNNFKDELYKNWQSLPA